MGIDMKNIPSNQLTLTILQPKNGYKYHYTLGLVSPPSSLTIRVAVFSRASSIASQKNHVYPRSFPIPIWDPSQASPSRFSAKLLGRSVPHISLWWKSNIFYFRTHFQKWTPYLFSAAFLFFNADFAIGCFPYQFLFLFFIALLRWFFSP